MTLFVNFCVCRFENRLLDIFKYVKESYDKLEGRLQADGLKVRILRTLKAWEDTIYPKDFMNKLNNTFLGLPDIVVSVPVS